MELLDHGQEYLEDLQSLAEEIAEGNCVLMLGPEVPFANQPNDAHYILSQHLKKYMKRTFSYYWEDEFFHFDKDRARIDGYKLIKKKFESIIPSNIYNKLAEIPFQLIISLSPDKLLYNVFRYNGFDCHFDYYYKKRNPQPIESNINKPIIYNLFGSIDNKDSMLYTYTDLFQYITKITSDHQVSQTIRTKLQNASHFIFLGFDYDKWYLKLLLHILDIKGSIDSNGIEVEKKVRQKEIRNHISRLMAITLDSTNSLVERRNIQRLLTALAQRMKQLEEHDDTDLPTFKTYYEKNLEIEFIEGLNIRAFVNQLHIACENEEKCKMRVINLPNDEPIPSIPNEVATTITDLIRTDKIKEVFPHYYNFLNHLQHIPKFYEIKIEILKLERRNNANNKNRITDKITEEEFRIERSNITEALLYFLQQLK